MKTKVRYSYCIDENDKFVFIRDLNSSSRYEHKFRCLECGKEMIANMGSKRAWHFSHKSDLEAANCSGESYLHKLAKRRIYEKFVYEDSFPITFRRDVPCANNKTCPCYDKKYCISQNIDIPCDLKNWKGKTIFDTCEIEKRIDNEFQPDILLSNSKNVNRLFIEIYKSHKSTEEKLSSNNRVIETKQIKSESDIDDIIKRGFVEGDNCNLNEKFNPDLPKIIKKDSPIDRFVLYKSGSAYIRKSFNIEEPDNVVLCDKISEKLYPNSLLELNYKNRLGFNLYSENNMDSYQIGLVYAYQKLKEDNKTLRNCKLCKYWKYNNFYSKQMCTLYKKMRDDDPFPEQCKANSCKEYKLNEELIEHIIPKLKDLVEEV